MELGGQFDRFFHPYSILLIFDSKSHTMFLKLLFILLSSVCMGQIPAYYSPVNFSLTGEALKLQLAQLITDTHTTNLPYTATGTTDVWDALKLADLDPANIQNVLLVYGWNDSDTDVTNDHSRSKDLSCHTSSCNGLWVREHVYPRSLGTPNLGFEFAGADAHHLRSIDSQRNSLRSNRVFEDGLGVMSYVTIAGNWYPGDEWRGDVARMMMYMYVRYPTQCLATNVGTGSTSYADFADMPDIFLEWNQEDPVSTYELNRNVVLENLQGNRNPFIDNPYIATMIWNGPAATDSWGVLRTTEHTTSRVLLYPTVTYDYIYLSDPENRTFNYTVYNMIGQTIVAGTTAEKIDLTGYGSGLFMVRVGDKVWKVLKE